MKDLPIYPHLENICASLLASPSRFLVLTAETAAGKSTTVPIALLPHVRGKIIMLEPRRIATVAIAARIAALLGEEPGKTAGYRLHLDSRVGPDTRIEVITEAILTRRIQGDPSLGGISVVILDEFHERSVHADLCLALLREIVTLRDDLFVLVMSATIDTARIAAFLDAPVVTVPGRQFPVEISYEAPTGSGRGFYLEDRIARTVKNELEKKGRNILVFLPGIGEIRRVKSLLENVDAEILVLHSSVPFEEQKRVLEATPGMRRVILSSSIAETSITVPGVSVVIDSGLSRIGRFNIPTGMYRLVTESESVFSAVQRAGRAGRTGPGRCIRMWAEHDIRLSDAPCEIERTDIMPLVLECALWGVSEPAGLAWLDPPNPGAWKKAQELLVTMNALDASGRITDTGRRMTTLGVHPRIASVALAGSLELAVRHSQYSDNPREKNRFRADLERRLAAVKTNSGTRSDKKADAPIALLSGFPDRIARHTADGVYQFPSGRLASLPKEARASRAIHSEWIVALDVDSGEREGQIWSFEELDTKEAEDWLLLHSKTSTEVTFTTGKEGKKGLKKTEFRTYGKLLLSERPLESGPEDHALAFCDSLRKTGLEQLPWSDASTSFLVRSRFWYARGKSGEKQNLMNDESLKESLEVWLVPFIPAKSSLTSDALLDALRCRCDAHAVDRDVPSRIVLPNGQSRPLMYEELVPGEGPTPVLEIKIQELFGCAKTPLVMNVPVLLRLLSPARRPLQITRDLEGFWKNTWPEVVKEMKGRYPKHKWPDNPFDNVK